MSREDADSDSVDTAALIGEPDSAELSAFSPLVAALESRMPPRLPTGTVLAEHFEVEEPVGTGGMGIVYRARDLRLGRTVAVKLHRPMAHGTERLMREATAMAKLSHPNVVTVHEVGTHDGMLFIAMEFVDGVTARRWVTDGERSVKEIGALYHAAGKGLAAAHEAGLIHRDFKPENVIVGSDDVARVVDFGLARSAAEDTLPAESLTGGDGPNDSGSLTVTGAAVGTPAYMAPEQFAGGDVDARTDQFSFCVSLYEAVYGSGRTRTIRGETPRSARRSGRPPETPGSLRSCGRSWCGDSRWIPTPGGRRWTRSLPSSNRCSLHGVARGPS